MEIVLSSRFKKSFRKLHPRVQKKAIEKSAIFKNEPFNLRFDTHDIYE